MSRFVNYLLKMHAGFDLESADVLDAANMIFSGAATPAQISAFATFMRFANNKSEVVEIFVNTILKKNLLQLSNCNYVTVLDFKYDGTFTAICSYFLAKHGFNSVNYILRREKIGTFLKSINLEFCPSMADAEFVVEAFGFCFVLASMSDRSVRNVMFLNQELGFTNIFDYIIPMSAPYRYKTWVIVLDDSSMLSVKDFIQLITKININANILILFSRKSTYEVSVFHGCNGEVVQNIHKIPVDFVSNGSVLDSNLAVSARNLEALIGELAVVVFTLGIYDSFDFAVSSVKKFAGEVVLKTLKMNL